MVLGRAGEVLRDWRRRERGRTDEETREEGKEGERKEGGEVEGRQGGEGTKN